MLTQIYTCDKCKGEFDQKELSNISVLVRGEYPQSKKDIHLCGGCREKLGLGKAVDQNSADSLANRLVDLIYEIAEEAIDNR